MAADLAQTMEETMQRISAGAWRLPLIPTVVISAVVGIALGAVGNHGLAQIAAPTEHKGLTVETLGSVSEESMTAQINLDGRILLLRAITIAPGGQIAKHSHENVPGLVKVISGEWIEGGESGETTFSADSPTAIIEH